jgi:CHRD domain-containing protein
MQGRGAAGSLLADKTYEVKPMKTKKLLIAVPVMLALILAAIVIVRAAGPRQGRGDLSGYQEIPTLSTPASGSLHVTIGHDDESLEYTLSYDGFETDVTQSHIHLGRPAFNGGIMVFLCTNLAPPAGVPIPPPCPARGGTVSGELTAANVVGPTAQGVSPTEFDEVVQALRAEASYGNVHTTRFPGGEIRAQVIFHAQGAAIR